MSTELSSSPKSMSSPTHRRSVSPTDSEVTSRAHRHSPTLGRSYDPHDPQVRERQRTMDVDMAMQLSLARRETLHASPVATFASPSPGPSPFDHHMPAGHPIPEHIEDMDLDDAPRDDADYNDHDHVHYRTSIDGDTLSPHRQPSPIHLRTEPIHPPPNRNHLDDPSPPTFGLPTYQANASQTTFDFSRMEEFAAEEKVKLGLHTPLHTRFSISALRGGPRPSTSSAPISNAHGGATSAVPDTAASTDSFTVLPSFADATSGGASSSILPTDRPQDDETSPKPMRHRKLSQSNPQPKTRKGIGGKMALFESNHDTPSSFSARLGQVLGGSTGIGGGSGAAGGAGPGLSSGPSYDHITGVPVTPALTTGGILLNTGHDRPYRFSFYSNALSATIHARSLSELPADGQTFEQLFQGINPAPQKGTPPPPHGSTGNRASDGATIALGNGNESYKRQGQPAVPSAAASSFEKTPYNGNNNASSLNGATALNGSDQDVNTWWLDVQSPTDEEMKMLSKVFSIHPLTTEDILMEETREKIELFRNYYLVCFRSFDQDPYSPTHLEPLNMYIIVFREGILSFHFRPTPHPQNVRRRIKQLKDYISVTSDWISYALIDDITDAFGPLIQSIEYEVDSIDELVLILKEAEQSDMLRRIGTCRKKVMGLLRLMGNKADVVKGLAKRCNENWRVAPTSDIGLYLSDIQDHLITMTQNLNHYEKILSRSHSNYLAQISIEMTDANNQINDVLSKLTALGTVLIPMNLVTGLWGMNVTVPGEGVPGFTWFLSIIGVLAAFALVGGYSTYKFMVPK